MFLACLLLSGPQAWWCAVVQTEDTELFTEWLCALVEKKIVPPALPWLLLPLQKLPSVPSLPSLVILFASGPRNSVAFLVVFYSVAGLIHGKFAHWIVAGLGYHNSDGSAVLFVFVMMMHGQGEAPPGLYPSGVWRCAHHVGLRYSTSFQPNFQPSFHSFFVALRATKSLFQRSPLLSGIECPVSWLPDLRWWVSWRMLMMLVPCFRSIARLSSTVATAVSAAAPKQGSKRLSNKLNLKMLV